MISIVVLPYLEKNRPYLDLCIESINNLDFPKDDMEVIVVGRGDYVPMYDGVKTVVNPRRESPYAVGINYGISQTDKRSDFIMVLNDDVVLTRDCLKQMLAYSAKYCAIINGISPCDNKTSYELTMGIIKDDILYSFEDKEYRIEKILEDKHYFLNARSIYYPGFIKQDEVCTYATIIPRKIFDKIGLFDENFSNGQEDLDFVWRANEAGFMSGIALSALVWHFSGVTANSLVKDDDRIKNMELFKQKWGARGAKLVDEALTIYKNKLAP